MAAAGFDEALAAADLVITGEGRIDEQTAFGKTAMGVAQRAQAAGKPLPRDRRRRDAGGHRGAGGGRRGDGRRATTARSRSTRRVAAGVAPDRGARLRGSRRRAVDLVHWPSPPSRHDRRSSTSTTRRPTSRGSSSARATASGSRSRAMACRSRCSWRSSRRRASSARSGSTAGRIVIHDDFDDPAARVRDHDSRIRSSRCRRAGAVRVLLDTHAFLWAAIGSDRLCRRGARRSSRIRRTSCCFSAASAYEIAIKAAAAGSRCPTRPRPGCGPGWPCSASASSRSTSQHALAAGALPPHPWRSVGPDARRPGAVEQVPILTARSP